MVVPFGPIKAFANVTFDERHTTEPISYKLEWVTSYDVGAGAFPIDKRGLSDAPRKLPQGTWKYVILAPYGLSGPAAYAAVEQGLADIVTALQTPYTYSGAYLLTSAEVSGQVGDLVVLRANQTDAMQCFARVEMLEVSVKAGHILAYELPLQFTFLSEWQAAST